MTTSVKHIASTQRGAPTINGTAGTLIAALDALFVSGWGVTTALSVTVAGGVATATLTPGETFDRDAVILVAGATPGALNGEARVASTSNTSITWPTSAPDGAATGTITIKYAPQTSWVKVFGATNKAVYRSTHVQSAGHYLRVDDTGTTTARVRGFESMTDVDTGIGPFPTDVQISGGAYWHKSLSANATAVKYRIICDERIVFVCIAAGSSQGSTYLNAAARGFGDTLPRSPAGDAWSTVLSGCAASNGSSGGAFDGGSASSLGSGFCVAPRAFTALGSPVLLDPRPYHGATGGTSGSDGHFGALPSTVTGEATLSTVFLREQSAASPPRTNVPGVNYLPQSGAAAVIADGDRMIGSGALADRSLLAIATGSPGTTTPAGIYLVDITGPWR